MIYILLKIPPPIISAGARHLDAFDSSDNELHRFESDVDHNQESTGRDHVGSHRSEVDRAH